jgi:hypothetical protein
LSIDMAGPIVILLAKTMNKVLKRVIIMNIRWSNVLHQENVKYLSRLQRPK